MYEGARSGEVGGFAFRPSRGGQTMQFVVWGLETGLSGSWVSSRRQWWCRGCAVPLGRVEEALDRLQGLDNFVERFGLVS